jgi:hypothetical protein
MTLFNYMGWERLREEQRSETQAQAALLTPAEVTRLLFLLQ